MIQFNKTFFQFTKHFLLLLMFVCITVTTYASERTHGKLIATPEPSGSGLIYLATEKTDTPTYNGDTGPVTLKVTSWKGDSWQLPTSVWCHANTNREGYIWGGWYKDNTLLGNGEPIIEHTFTPTATSNAGWGQENTNFTEEHITAKWLQPQVESVTPNPVLFNITDPTIVVPYQPATFTVKNCSMKSHFSLVYEENSNFTILDNTFTFATNAAPDIFNGTATISVGYTPTIEHGGHDGYAILKSALYSGTEYTDETSKLYKRVNFKAIENYKPEFEASNNSKDLALDLGSTTYGVTSQEVGPTRQSNPGDLKPDNTTRNYAAKQPRYSSGLRQKTTTWTTTIVEESGFEGLFEFVTETKDTDDPQVVFTPKRDIVGKKTWSGEGTTHTFYAQIKMVCTFYDNKTTPEEIKSDEKVSWVKVTVEQSDKEELYYTYNSDDDAEYEYEYNFGDVAMGEVETIKIPFKQTNIQDLEAIKVYSANSADIFETKFSGDQLVVSIKKDVITCGECTLTIRLDGVGNISKKTISTTNNFTVYAKMTLATPQVTAIGSNGKITFTWNKVQGATSYKVYSDEALTTPIGTIPATDADQYQYIKEGLKSTGASFTAYVVAVGECDNSEAGTATGTTNISTIKLGNASAEALGMVTGMDGNSDYTTYPYSQLRKVDVTAAFDKNGKALFDRIYIFEKTEIKNSKWVTPYYVYNRSAVDTYTNVGGDDPYTITEGATSKDERLNAINIADDCNELYFTGYLPFGITGNENQNAVLHFKGDGSKELHLYLDSLQIYAAGKTGNTIQPGTNDLATNYYTKGNGSAIAIESSSSLNPFIVNIHLRGRNTLDAAKGSNVNISNTQVSINDSPNHYSSPICVLPTGNNQVATLKFTDNWPTDVENKLAMTHTYGALNLKEKDNDNQSGISIDLGNAYTQLEFNGGQYKFQDIAAAYKTTFYSGNKDDVTVNVTVYGVSSSRYTTTTRRGSDISIKDGTFNAAGNNGITFYGSSLTIDGGSYYTGDEDNSGIPRENGTGNIGLVLYNTDDADRSPVTTFWNSDGKELHKFLINYSDIYGSIAGNNQNDADCNAAIITNFGQMMNDLFPHAGVDDAATGTTYHKSLAQYYDGTNKVYGNNSLVLKNGKLNLMVPYLDCNGVHLPWQVCAPSIQAEHAMGTIPVGGDISNLGGCPQHSKNNTIDRMLFMQLDEYTLDCLEDGRPIKDNNVQGNSVTLVYTEDAVYGNIRDAVPYTITNKVYMLMPIVAAKWTLFSPPFDVANVYVIEPCPEDQLVKDFNGVRGKIRGQENIAAARKEQAGRIIDLYSMWYAHARNIGVTPSDFFGMDAATPYGSFVNDWIAYEKVNKINSDGIYTPVIEKLIHFMGKEADYSIYGEGKNWLDANYYLYQSNGEWTLDENNHYRTTWSDVTTVANGTNAIMNKGQVYAIQFPYNSINGRHDPSTTWDYWTGKYLLIESTAGPHTINGSNFVTSALSAQNVSSGTASLFGNSTFAEIQATLPEKDGVTTTLWALEKKSAAEAGTERDIHEMVQQMTATMAPTTGVLLANFVAPKGLIAKSINYTTGEITYEKIDDPNTGDIETGIPTILGDATLIVEPTAEGLTITPLKEQHVMLFDAEGKMIFSKYMSEEENVSLPTGVYVVRGEYEQVKAIKK